MNTQDKIHLFEETIGASIGSLTENNNLSDIPEFDSMAKLSFIVMMEDNFEVALNSESIRKLETVSDVIKLMN